MKISVEVEIPDYKIKYCKFAEFCGYFQEKGFCNLSQKNVKVNRDGKMLRPYGCRCLAKKDSI
jgi:hypothetical protein